MTGLLGLSPDAPLAHDDARMLVGESLPACCDESVVAGFSLLEGAATGSILTREGAPFVRPRAVCVIGAFDGMHRGHAALMARGVGEAQARGCEVVAVTFSPDPAEVLSGPVRSMELMAPRDRAEALLCKGASSVVLLDFTPELAGIDYQRFVCEVLGGLMDVEAIVVGANFRLGSRGLGTVAALQELGRACGFDVIGMELADEGGQAISATRIRGLLHEGSVESAAGLLGRCHSVEGTVERGRGEGTAFGFPTANVRMDERACLPAEGVYAGFVTVGAAAERVAYPAAINVGKPRSFGEKNIGEAFLEATLLGFEGDLYERSVAVTFVRWLRGPRTFSSLEELEGCVLGNVDWVRRTFGEVGIEL